MDDGLYYGPDKWDFNYNSSKNSRKAQAPIGATIPTAQQRPGSLERVPTHAFPFCPHQPPPLHCKHVATAIKTHGFHNSLQADAKRVE